MLRSVMLACRVIGLQLGVLARVHDDGIRALRIVRPQVPSGVFLRCGVGARLPNDLAEQHELAGKPWTVAEELRRVIAKSESIGSSSASDPRFSVRRGPASMNSVANRHGQLVTIASKPARFEYRSRGEIEQLVEAAIAAVFNVGGVDVGADGLQRLPPFVRRRTRTPTNRLYLDLSPCARNCSSFITGGWDDAAQFFGRVLPARAYP